VRELYIDFPLATLAVALRQQQMPGARPFLRGDDLSTGSTTLEHFLEPANEELRKTNIMFKMNVDVRNGRRLRGLRASAGTARRDRPSSTLRRPLVRAAVCRRRFPHIDRRLENREGDDKDVTGGHPLERPAGDLTIRVS